jgi:hypothetical protein
VRYVGAANPGAEKVDGPQAHGLTAGGGAAQVKVGAGHVVQVVQVVQPLAV